MEDRMFVKPGPDRKVRFPQPIFRHLADVGELVPKDTYWLRRLADGDVVLVQTSTEQAK